MTADRLEAVGRRLAAVYVRVVGGLAAGGGILLLLGVLMIGSGAVPTTGSTELRPTFLVIFSGTAVLLLLLGTALLAGRGQRLLGVLLPSLVAGLYGLVLARAPVLGLLGVNAETMALIFLLGLAYLSLLVVQGGRPSPVANERPNEMNGLADRQ